MIDALLITAILVPALYVFMLRPLVSEIAQHQRSRQQLEHQNRMLVALARAEKNQRKHTKALIEATEALNSSLDPEQVLDRILEQTQRVIPCTVVAVLRMVDDWVVVVRYRGSEDVHPLVEGFPLDFFERVQSAAASTIPVRIDDTELDFEWPLIPGLEWVRSLVLAPLVAEEQTLGFLATLSDQPGSFPRDVTDFLVTFANYAAVAIQRGRGLPGGTVGTNDCGDPLRCQSGFDTDVGTGGSP